MRNRSGWNCFGRAFWSPNELPRGQAAWRIGIDATSAKTVSARRSGRQTNFYAGEPRGGSESARSPAVGCNAWCTRTPGKSCLSPFTMGRDVGIGLIREIIRSVGIRRDEWIGL
jgi:hypothetical protein